MLDEIQTTFWYINDAVDDTFENYIPARHTFSFLALDVQYTLLNLPYIELKPVVKITLQVWLLEYIWLASYFLFF